jgi:nucleoside phosphorylase
MNKVNGINIVVAMKREATPLINYWNLKENSKNFYSNKKKKINLIISGIGKKKAEKATIYLGQKTNNYFFLNIGIAGHKNFKLGEIILISKVTDNKNKYSWYPSLLWKTKIKKSPLMTVIFPKIRYTTNYLYDMEAAGFFKGARNFVGPEKAQCIKIVSDNKDSSIFKISSKKIENWVYSKTTIINKLVKEFLKI